MLKKARNVQAMKLSFPQVVNVASLNSVSFWHKVLRISLFGPLYLQNLSLFFSSLNVALHELVQVMQEGLGGRLQLLDPVL